MHISEGVLSGFVLASGAIFAIAGVAFGLKKTSYEKIPEVAVLTSAFFIASLIHIPIGPASIHLVLNGIAGILLGWSVFPAILVGLSLQALFFQFGGFTTLGVNTFNMAFPAIISFLVFKTMAKYHKKNILVIAGFICGMLGIAGGTFLVAVSLLTTGEAFLPVAKILIISHLPVMIIEGVITAMVIGFLQKVSPELLPGREV